MSSEGHRAVTGGRLGAFIPATIRRQKKDPPQQQIDADAEYTKEDTYTGNRGL